MKLSKENEVELRKFGVLEIYLFGSVVRGEAKETSDVDFFVVFGSYGADLFNLYDLEKFLEKRLQTKVDLGTKKSLHPNLRDQILKEAIRVA